MMANKWKKLESLKDAKRSNASFLLDGEEYFTSLIQAIESAKTKDHYVYILGWMLDVKFSLTPNQVNEETLFTVLKSAARRNVEIRILISDNLNPEYAEKLQEYKQLLPSIKYSKASPGDKL